MTIADLIRARLDAIGWTVADLARATNTPKQNLSPILAGKRPMRPSHLLLIDAALNLGLDLNEFERREG